MHPNIGRDHWQPTTIDRRLPHYTWLERTHDPLLHRAVRWLLDGVRNLFDYFHRL